MIRVNIKVLRREHPEWTWKAIHCVGGDWRYRGTRGEQRVSIMAYNNHVEQYGHPMNPQGWWYIGKYEDWKGEVV